MIPPADPAASAAKAEEEPIIKQPASQAIESVARVLCENDVGARYFSSDAIMAPYRWKALMMYVDQRDQEFKALVKELSRALGRGKRR